VKHDFEHLFHALFHKNLGKQRPPEDLFHPRFTVCFTKWVLLKWVCSWAYFGWKRLWAWRHSLAAFIWASNQSSPWEFS